MPQFSTLTQGIHLKDFATIYGSALPFSMASLVGKTIYDSTGAPTTITTANNKLSTYSGKFSTAPIGTGTVVWSYTIGATPVGSEGFNYNTAVIDRTTQYVIVPTRDGTNRVFAFNKTTGAVIWNVTLNGPMEPGMIPASSGRVIFMPSQQISGTMYSLNTTNGSTFNSLTVGTTRAWTKPPYDSSYMWLHNGQLIYSYNFTNLGLKGSFGPVGGGFEFVTGVAAASSGTVYVAGRTGTGQGRIYTLTQPFSGNPTLIRTMTSPNNYSGRIKPSPFGAWVFVNTNSSKIEAYYNTATTPTWTYTDTSTINTTVTVNDDLTCFHVNGNGILRALNGNTGALLWSYTIAGSVLGNVGLDPSGNPIIFTAIGGSLRVINKSTGTVIWKIELNTPSGSLNASTPITRPEGYVYVCATDGKIYCIQPPTLNSPALFYYRELYGSDKNNGNFG